MPIKAATFVDFIELNHKSSAPKSSFVHRGVCARAVTRRYANGPLTGREVNQRIQIREHNARTAEGKCRCTQLIISVTCRVSGGRGAGAAANGQAARRRGVIVEMAFVIFHSRPRPAGRCGPARVPSLLLSWKSTAARDTDPHDVRNPDDVDSATRVITAGVIGVRSRMGITDKQSVTAVVKRRRFCASTATGSDFRLLTRSDGDSIIQPALAVGDVFVLDMRTRCVG
ncbi:hypothetical protein EVAR_60610_1 [Eumeta japonica]|uniref:Uncharacterized protein n=1 Tax=Eumeta variegata TaxID=151549 RepID=A0A4C1YBC1_EUMVA|nr:hypothetical protein EVAR_60610_1 [Eumeta japonica]